MSRPLYQYKEGKSQKREELLISRYDWMYHEGFKKPIDRSNEITHYKVGDHYHVRVSAPGTGYYDYVVTRIDRSGLYGRLVEANVSELEARDVY